MAWRCSGSTNAELLANLTSNSLLSSNRVLRSMSSVDRAAYVPVAQRGSAYEDAPQSIGYGATISAPHMHAHALEALEPYLVAGSHVLDVGSGSGYLLGVFHEMVGGEEAGSKAKDAVVVGVDHLPALVEMARTNLRQDGKGALLDKGQIEVLQGDGREGHALKAPYHAIHVGAASKGIPQDLVRQLGSPGRMFIPVEDEYGQQDIWLVDKNEYGTIKKEKLFGVRVSIS